jgi:hypothetical protein
MNIRLYKSRNILVEILKSQADSKHGSAPIIWEKNKLMWPNLLNEANLVYNFS